MFATASEAIISLDLQTLYADDDGDDDRKEAHTSLPTVVCVLFAGVCACAIGTHRHVNSHFPPAVASSRYLISDRLTGSALTSWPGL